MITASTGTSGRRRAPALRGAVLVGLALVWLLGGCATGGLKTDAGEAARVKVVLDRWLEALGGPAALEALKGIEVRATVEQADGTGKFEVHTWQTATTQYRSELMFQNGVSVVEAYDGTTAWRRHSALGFGFVPAEELAVTLRRDSVRAALHVTKDYPERRLLPDATVGEQRCRVLSLRGAVGGAETWFFDAESGHLLQIDRSAGGETIVFSDYRATGGIFLPYVLQVKHTAGSYMIRRIEAVLNPLVGPSLWKAPAEALGDGLKVAAILDRHLAAVGGRAALGRVRTRVTRQEVEITTSGVKYPMTISQKRPNLMVTEEELPGLGRQALGYDGATGWVSSELLGYRVLKGNELQQMVNGADLSTNSVLAERCPFRRLLGPRDVDGRRTQAVALATLQGPAGLFYFAEDNGQLLRIESGMSAGPQGVLKVTLDFSDFRAVDGVTLAFRTTLTNPAVKTVTTLLAVKHNVPLADEIFKPRKDWP